MLRAWLKRHAVPQMNTMLIHATSALVDQSEYTRIDLTFNAAKTNVSLLDSFAHGMCRLSTYVGRVTCPSKHIPPLRQV